MPKSAHQSYLDRNSRSIEQRIRYRASLMKKNAAARGISWDLTPADIIEMWNKQEGRCAFTSQRMTLTHGRGLQWRNWSMSIDRLDPSQGYTKENVVLCRFDANTRKAKRNFFSADFLDTFQDFVSNAIKVRPELNAIAA